MFDKIHTHIFYTFPSYLGKKTQQRECNMCMYVKMGQKHPKVILETLKLQMQWAAY